ncbi:TolB family protein [Cellulomonas sp. ICMP 17802]|uniref:TolB family protein n=1 Tax=Cellulomonas sp. ICMP 17802 TaxID=3239199 RepID=UPI00351AEE9A
MSEDAVRWVRELAPGQRSQLVVLDVDTGGSTVLLELTEDLVESPSWHPSGRWIVLNADGRLFRVEVDAPETGLVPIPLEGVPTDLNNDHILSPDGSLHYVSVNDGHVYVADWAGGPVRRVTSSKEPGRAFRHFLHGISPDGGTLAYVGTELLGDDEIGTRRLWTVDLGTGVEALVGDGFSPADGPEYSPDGTSLWFNSEVGSDVPGHAQIFRHGLRDGATEQVTHDERVNWFPHVSPDGRRVCYLSYPPGTQGHPADLPVELVVLDLATGERRTVAALPGGQGTINVNSWAPDSRRLAYVAYPVGATTHEHQEQS